MQDNTILITFSDDGIGFDTNEVIYGTEKGMGYSNMISRIRSIKGTIEIESQPDFGMKAIIRVIV
jgi:signal transduction histidine kinase